jgi:hypothetical protein
MMPARRDASSDEGVLLVLTLMFLTVFGLWFAAILQFTGSSFLTTDSVNLQRAKLYAADAAINEAVTNMRSSATSGQVGSSCDFDTPSPINGQSVHVLCQPVAGSGTTTTTRPQYDLLALTSATDEGIIETPTGGAGGGGADAVVNGPVYSNGVVARNASSSHTWTINGTAQAVVSCIKITTPPGCTSGQAKALDPNYGMASNGFPSQTNPAAACMPGAAKFVPGYYTSAPVRPAGCASKPMWFSPGMYYFDFTSASHLWTLTGTVVGGTPNPTNFDPTSASGALSMPGSCVGDDAPPPNDGVEFVFGADTTMSIDKNANVELCPPPSTTSQEISIYGYGGDNQTSPGLTTVTQTGTAASTSSPAFTTPAQGAAVDASSADVTFTASKKTAVETVSKFAPLPNNSSVEKATLQVVHWESNALGSMAFDVKNTQTNDDLCTTYAAVCNQVVKNNTVGHEDDLDVTTWLQSELAQDATTLQDLQVTYTVKSAGKTSQDAHLDGAQLKIKYAPPGNFRDEAGCAVLPAGMTTSDAHRCPVLSIPTEMTGAFYTSGTVYAPLASVEVVTSQGDPVELSRGVIARSITAYIAPGGSTSNAFDFAVSSDRLVLLTAKIGGVSITRTLVRFDDTTNHSKPGSTVDVESWEYLR